MSDTIERMARAFMAALGVNTPRESLLVGARLRCRALLDGAPAESEADRAALNASHNWREYDFAAACADCGMTRIGIYGAGGGVVRFEYWRRNGIRLKRPNVAPPCTEKASR